MQVWLYRKMKPRPRGQDTRRRVRKHLHPRSSAARQGSFLPLDKDLSWKSPRWIGPEAGANAFGDDICEASLAAFLYESGCHSCRLKSSTRPNQFPLMPPFAASFFCKFARVNRIWRKRVGVEPTILAAKDRINGFEGHEDHRIPFASTSTILQAARIDTSHYFLPVRITFAGWLASCAEWNYRRAAGPVQLFGTASANFLRAISRSLGSVHTS